MSLREQIEKALNTPFDAAKQGLDESKYAGLGVYHDGPTLETSTVVISRELNTDSGTLTPEGKWIPAPDPTARTSIDIQSDIGQTKGKFGDIVKLKNKFLNLTRNLPEGSYYLHADNPTKAKYYQRVFKDHPWIVPSGEQGGLRVKGEMIKYDTLKLNIPDKETRFAQMQDSSNFRDWRTQEVPMTDLSEDISDIANRYDMQYRFNVNNLEGSELFRYAEKWLTDNPGKTLRDFKKETGYDGPPLKPRQRKGEPIRLSYKGKSTDAQVKRVKETQFKTEEEARYVRGMQKQARELSQDPIHEIVYGGRPSVAEHNLRGDHEMMSISDPDFAAYKTEVETRALKKGYLTGLDNISGEIVIAPQESFNKYDPSSSPGARVISEGTDIATLIGKLPTKATQVGNIVSNNPVTRALGIGNDARLASVVENMTDLAKGIPPGARFGMSLLPGLGIVGDTADAAVKLEEAQAPDASWLDKAQASVASTVAATSVIPEATSQAYNFIAGLGLGASDVIEHYGESIWRHIGEKVTDNKGLSRLWYQEPETDDHTNQPTKTD